MSPLKQLPKDVDVIVIGAGPAGVAAASILHNKGHRVLVLERARFPRFVIGESLLPHSMDLLEAAGLLEAASGRKYLRKHGAAFLHGDQLASFDFGDQHTQGWSWTWQVPRDDFDQTLAEAVEAMGVPILYEHAVAGVVPGIPSVVNLTDADGAEQSVSAKFVIDASGYGRVLPRLFGLDKPSTLPVRHSLFAWFSGDEREEGILEGRTWVCMHPDGAWIWVIPFSNGNTSVGVVATPEFFARYTDDPAARLWTILREEPNTARRLQRAELAMEPVLIPGYSASVSALHGPGWVLVGNSGEFLDPVFSAGVTVALESAVLAANLASAQLSGETVDWQTAYATPLLGAIDVYRSFIDGWYSGDLPAIFFSPRKDPSIRKQITSVLAGYLLDGTNPFVSQAGRRVPNVARLVRESRSAI